MALGTPIAGTLANFNVGLSAAVGFLVPLSAQIDALIAVGLGPFKADISSRLNAALGAQAGLAISIGNPFLSLQILLSAIANLQAAIQGALAFGIPSPQIGIQLSAFAALSGSLAITLGGLELAIRLALQIKIPALQAAADLRAALNAGPAFALAYEGPLGVVGSEISAAFNSGLTGNNLSGPPSTLSLSPADSVYGVTVLTSVPSVQLAIQAILSAPAP